MKWLVPVILLIAVSSFADNGPEILKFKNGVTFPHRAHQTYLKSDCKQCHRKAGPGKIEGFSKDAAHRLCRTCHAIRRAGPAACRDCHKK
ncbi:MAG: cytochrome c3 family protein [Geobacteraceae bacterium]|nr:cytochrome c3 family protein [Geobacteraceae bacterium]